MRVPLFLATAVLFFTGVVAHADTLTFTITSGADIATFNLDSAPVPASYIAGDSTFFNIPVTFDGTTTTDLIVFGNTSTGISFADLSNTLFFLGPQLYTGTEDAPIFSAATFSVATATGDSAQIAITRATAVTPEPSSVLLLSTGMLVLLRSSKRLIKARA